MNTCYKCVYIWADVRNNLYEYNGPSLVNITMFEGPISVKGLRPFRMALLLSSRTRLYHFPPDVGRPLPSFILFKSGKKKKKTHCCNLVDN